MDLYISNLGVWRQQNKLPSCYLSYLTQKFGLTYQPPSEIYQETRKIRSKKLPKQAIYFLFEKDSVKLDTYTGCIIQHAYYLKVCKPIIQNCTPEWHVKCYKMNCLHRKENSLSEEKEKLVDQSNKHDTYTPYINSAKLHKIGR